MALAILIKNKNTRVKKFALIGETYVKETLTVLHTLKFILAKFSLVSFPMFQKSIADKICNATAKIIGLRLYLH